MRQKQGVFEVVWSTRACGITLHASVRALLRYSIETSTKMKIKATVKTPITKMLDFFLRYEHGLILPFTFLRLAEQSAKVRACVSHQETLNEVCSIVAGPSVFIGKIANSHYK